MAAAYYKLFFNNRLIRRHGNNLKEIKAEFNYYKSLSHMQLLKMFGYGKLDISWYKTKGGFREKLTRHIK